MGLYAWSRHLDGPTTLLPMTSGGRRYCVQCSRWGGALALVSHAGVQYINNRDHGRQIQSALFSTGRNPTEAGDTWSDLARPAGCTTTVPP